MTDAMVLSSPFMERAHLRWRLAAFNLVVALDCLLFAHAVDFRMPRLNLCVAAQFSVMLATVFLLLKPERFRQHTVKVEVVSTFALSLSMAGTTSSHLRAHSGAHWLGYLIALMMMKVHPAAILVAFGAFFIVGCGSRDFYFDYSHRYRPRANEAQGWLDDGAVVGFFLFEPFATAACCWYCHVFTCKVRAIRDGNFFSDEDLNPDATRRTLVPGQSLHWFHHVIQWWRLSTDNVIAGSPIAARRPALAMSCVSKLHCNTRVTQV